MLATVAVGMTLMVFTSASGVLIDKAGRRTLLLGGTILMAAALGTLSLSLFKLNNTPRVQGYVVRIGDVLS